MVEYLPYIWPLACPETSVEISHHDLLVEDILQKNSTRCTALHPEIETANPFIGHDLVCFVAEEFSSPRLINALAQRVDPAPLLALVTGHSLISALKAVQHGAWDFLTLPTEDARLTSVLQAAHRRQNQNRQAAALLKENMQPEPSASVLQTPHIDNLDQNRSNAFTQAETNGTTQPDFCQPFWQQERAIIENTVQHFDGNISRAAAVLEISPSTIYRKRQSWGEKLTDA